MIIKKNEKYKTEIIDLSSDGQGIGKIDNFTVFIEETIPGDIVEIKIKYKAKVNKFLREIIFTHRFFVFS